MGAGAGKGPSGLWVPVSRREMTELLDRPRELLLYFRLRDETYRAQWQYGEEHGDHVYYRGMVFEFVQPHTILFDLPGLADSVGLAPSQLVAMLTMFYRRQYVDALHFGVQVDEESVQATESYGLPVSDLIGTGGQYDGETWTPAALHMAPLTGGFLRMPKKAGDLSAEMLQFLAAVYLRARFRDMTEVRYKGRYRTLQAGEVMVSFGELAAELGVHHEQVRRWATYAERDGLLRRIPQGRDYTWQINRYPRMPKGVCRRGEKVC